MLVETLVAWYGAARLVRIHLRAICVVRLNSEVIEKYFLVTPGGGYILGLMIGFAVTGLIAPLECIRAFAMC
jgi:hypothetical protein